MITRAPTLLICFFLLAAAPSLRAADQNEGVIDGGVAVAGEFGTTLAGRWIINDSLSQNTDAQVEAAIKAAGGKVERRWFGSKEEDRYRGGPAEHELYDRISYDDVLTISYAAPEFTFSYEGEYQRVFFSDGRSHSTGVTDYFQQGGVDNSFAGFEDDSLLVEARPRDGGYTEEIYLLEENATRLRVELIIKPANFGAPINLVRIYDRAP